MAQLLIELGADLLARDRQGRTPLDLAGSENHSGIARMLRRQQA
jgi:ankyrin repeat protein